MELHWRLPAEAPRRFGFIGVVVVLVAAGYWWLSAPVATVPVTVTTPSASTSTGRIYVDVVGAVRRPGVVRLAAGARVFDAVEAAGGVRQGVAPGVNLARPVVDGEQIVVGMAASTAAVAAGGRTNLNVADASALEELDGIGPVLAKRIVAYRQSHGPFRQVRDLLDVPGVGDAKYAALADHVTV